MLNLSALRMCIFKFWGLGSPGFIFGQRREKGRLVSTVLTLDGEGGGGRVLKQPSSDVRWLGGRVREQV